MQDSQHVYLEIYGLNMLFRSGASAAAGSHAAPLPAGLKSVCLRKIKRQRKPACGTVQPCCKTAACRQRPDKL